MNYIFKGRICGYICDECSEPLSKVKVRLYRSRPEQDVTTLAVANPKDTFAILTEEQVRAKAGSLLIEVETNDLGEFTAELGDKQGYKGGAFEVDVYCGNVPHHVPGAKAPTPLQFSITTLQPLWRRADADFLAGWEYCVPSRFWCAIRARFGAWTICGRLTTCTDHYPIAGATVSAFDVDWLQDDALGSSVTDSTGHFRIDYVTADFQKTIFSPLINIEWVGGPDLYFKAELGGIILLQEPPSTGRTPGRQNVGHCFCVELCTDKVQPPPPDHIPHWQSVWDFAIHPAAPNPASAFSVEGYAGGPGNSYAFSGGIPLRGNCPLRNVAAPANPLKYRFVIGEWTTLGSPDGDAAVIPSTPPAILSPVTQIFSTLVGYVFYTNALSLPDSAPVYTDSSDLSTAADPDGAGWLKLDGKIVTVDMRNGTTSPVAVSEANFLRTFDLISLNSNVITSVHPVRMPGGLAINQAGRSLTAAEQEPIRRYRLQFEVRDSVSHLLVLTDTLDSIVIDNSAVVLALDLEELRTNACNPVAGGAVHILYTIDHPHLRSFGLSISNNNGLVHPPPALPTGTFVPPPPPNNYLFHGGAGGPHQSPGNNGGFSVNVAGDAPCAYRVTLAWQTRIYQDPGHSTEKLYCK
jgi:hypothetical protein